MKRCYNCKSEILFEDAQFCEHCGVNLSLHHDPDADALELEVTECQDEIQECAGDHFSRPAADTLGVETSAELVVSQSDGTTGENPPPLTPSTGENLTASGAVRRLSSAEVKNIEQHLYSSSAYLSDTEKEKLLRKASERQQLTRESVSGETPAGLTRPTMARRGRGIAYYLKSYVQLQGEIVLHENDELTIGERCYVLRKKPITPKAVISVGAGLLVVLAIIFIPLLVRNANPGKGEIVGIVLDGNHKPYVGGATIKFPQLGQSFQTDPQGFFRTGRIPPGALRMEYVLDNNVVATEYATVAAGDVTTLILIPKEPGASASASDIPHQNDVPREPTTISQTDEPSTVANSQRQITPPDRAASASQYGSVTLAANLEGAKIQIDGTPLGAGNLTYNHIKAGNRTYVVSKDGYQSATGTLAVTPGQAVVLSVTLPLLGETHSAPDPSNDYKSALAALKAGSVESAIAGFSAALKQQPDYGPAYMGRGDAYSLSHANAAAHDDYLRAAEIFRIHGDIGQSMTAFNKAVAADPKSVAAYLGRADLHLASHEEIAAVADYESALQLDKRNAQALLGLGEARFSQGYYKQAIKYFKDARSLDPTNAVVYQYLMLSYLGDDDLKNVRKSYDKFTEVATQEQLAHLHADKGYAAVLRVVQSSE